MLPNSRLPGWRFPRLPVEQHLDIAHSGGWHHLSCLLSRSSKPDWSEQGVLRRSTVPSKTPHAQDRGSRVCLHSCTTTALVLNTVHRRALHVKAACRLYHLYLWLASCPLLLAGGPGSARRPVPLPAGTQLLPVALATHDCPGRQSPPHCSRQGQPCITALTLCS